MATGTGFTSNILNYSGLLYAKSNNQTRFLDAIYAMGKSDGSGRRGVRKVTSKQFTVTGSYEDGAGSQPAITESASTTAPTAEYTTREQNSNCVQLYHRAVKVSYLKMSDINSLVGLNLGGQSNNVPNELDWQIARKMTQIKKDLNYTTLNGVYQEGTSENVAWKSKGLIPAITSNTATYANGTKISAKGISDAILAAMDHGFEFRDSVTTLWVNPGNLNDLDDAYKAETGFGLPLTRSDGGVAITRIVTHYGTLNVEYDFNIPAGTFLIVNMDELAIAELDVIDGGVRKGAIVYEELAKTGAATNGQIYGQLGLDFGAEWQHIKITEAPKSQG